MFVHELILQGKPEAMAIVDHERRFTYKETQQAVNNCRNRLYAAGVREGDRVGIFSRNSADFVFAYMGATSLGAIAVPINFQLSNREIAYIIKDSGIRVLLTYQPLNLVDALAALRCDLKVTQYDIKTMAKDSKKLAEAPALSADFDEHKPCATIYTSGTTGNPKGAVLSHRNLVANCEQMRDNGMGCKAEHNVLCVLPMYHAFGWTCSALYSFFSGATVVILDSFTPKETIAVIREEKVTDLYIVPSICSLLTKLATTEDMKTLRLVVSGGTTLPLQIQQDFIKKFGVDICEGYGLSETSPVVTMNPPEKPIVGSCGKIVPGIEWKLIDAEGNSVPQGEAGELIVKGENIPEPGVPESFKVLIKELQSIGLDIKVLNEDAKEISLQDEDEEDINETAKKLDFDVAGVDPSQEGAAAAPKAEDSYDEGAPSDDEKPDDIIADIGSLGSIVEPDAIDGDNGEE